MISTRVPTYKNFLPTDTFQRYQTKNMTYDSFLKKTTFFNSV